MRKTTFAAVVGLTVSAVAGLATAVGPEFESDCEVGTSVNRSP